LNRSSSRRRVECALAIAALVLCGCSALPVITPDMARVDPASVQFQAANGRIVSPERSRELATLRVIGFTRGEISAILLGELAILTLLALPIGMVLGHSFAAWIAAAVESESFRIPVVVSRSTYAFSALIVIVAAIGSGLLVRRRLDHLDLVAVLKSKE
jgi:putative ABC transport system permease protein